jgi:hypothetical protein
MSKAVEKEELTDPQKFALYQSVEYHWKRIGENYAGQDKAPVLLEFATSGSEAALIRKGYAQRKQVRTPWGDRRESTVLTKDGLRVGKEEFARRRGKAVAEYAGQLQADSRKRLEKERKETEKVSNLFKGMVLTDRHGRKQGLDEYIFHQLRRGAKLPKDTKVEFSYKQLKKIGEQVRELSP